MKNCLSASELYRPCGSAVDEYRCLCEQYFWRSSYVPLVHPHNFSIYGSSVQFQLTFSPQMLRIPGVPRLRSYRLRSRRPRVETARILPSRRQHTRERNPGTRRIKAKTGPVSTDEFPHSDRQSWRGNWPTQRNCDRNRTCTIHRFARSD